MSRTHDLFEMRLARHHVYRDVIAVELSTPLRGWSGGDLGSAGDLGAISAQSRRELARQRREGPFREGPDGGGGIGRARISAIYLGV